MPRVTTANLKNHLLQRLATKPIIHFYIYWTNTFNTRYSSTDKLVSVGPVTTQSREDYTGSVGTCTLTIDDTDHTLKTLIDSNQLEDSYGEIDLTFDDTPGEQIVLLLGRITDLSWGEGERTLTLTLESEVHSEEIGFTPTEEEYPDLNPDANNIPWPLIFGTPAHVPAVHVKHRFEGNLESMIWLTSDIYKAPSATLLANYTMNPATNATKIAQVIAGTADSLPSQWAITLSDSCIVNSYIYDEDEEILTTGDKIQNKIYIRNGEHAPQNIEVKININGIFFKGTFNGNEFTVTEANCPKLVNIAVGARDADDADFKNPQVLWLDTATENIVGCHCYIRSTESNNGRGYYNKCIKRDGYKYYFNNRWKKNNQSLFLPDEHNVIEAVYSIEKCGVLEDVSSYFYDQQLMWLTTKEPTPPYSNLLKYLKGLKDKNNFWFASEESLITLVDESGEDSEVYICNLLPSQSIRGVYAFRRDSIFHKRVFAPVPSNYYTKYLNYETSIGEVTAITMPNLLSDYYGQEWEDEIYVTLTSTVGPNAADIIEWILTNFTNITIDAASFNLASNWVESYPVNFALIEKENALRLCQKIAWESKCALSIINNIAILYYLPLVPAPIITLDEGSIEEKSITIEHIQNADLVTKLILEWKDSYKPRDPKIYSDTKRRSRKDSQHLTIGEQNIDLYGVREESQEILTYNVEEYVDKTGNFWLNRMSNSWARIKLKTFLQGTLLLPFDGAFLSLVRTDIPYNTFCVVMGTSYDYNSKTTTIDLLLPIKQGTNVVDDDFWTAVDVVPNVTNPAFKIKELAYSRDDPNQDNKIIFDRDPSSFHKKPSLPPINYITGTVDEVQPPTNTDDPNLIPGSDMLSVSIASTKSSIFVQTGVLAFSKDYWLSNVFKGERFAGSLNRDGTVEIERVIDDKIVQITGTQSGFGIGFYLGTMYSAGEIYSRGGKSPNSNLNLSGPAGQGIQVIVMNLGETSANAWTKSIINQFPIWLPVKIIEKYQNGVIVVGVYLEAKILRNLRYNNTTDKLQGTYMINGGSNSSNWFDMITFVDCAS